MNWWDCHVQFNVKQCVGEFWSVPCKTMQTHPCIFATMLPFHQLLHHPSQCWVFTIFGSSSEPKFRSHYLLVSSNVQTSCARPQCTLEWHPPWFHLNYRGNQKLNLWYQNPHQSFGSLKGLGTHFIYWSSFFLFSWLFGFSKFQW